VANGTANLSGGNSMKRRNAAISMMHNQKYKLSGAA
jgi:hypothetical protein